MRFHIDPDIAKASTPPAAFYSDPAIFAELREKVFARSWQLAGDLDRVKVPGAVDASTLLEGCLDEPLLLTRDKADRVHCLSNVCTHRGNRVVEGAGVETSLRCRYHGRRFGLDGKFLSMPEFEGAQSFPSPADDLPRIAHAEWGPLVFASLDPAVLFEELAGPAMKRLGWLPLDRARFEPARSRDYVVQANWALYCDNYLEGFHIPFVHSALNDALDYGDYRTELLPWSSLQVGVSKRSEGCFEIPPSSPDFGQDIAAYYLWLFPNTMLNFYPWGLRVNIAKPLAVDRTKVSYLGYVWDPSKLDRGASADLDRVEHEDEAVVESVQRGLRSRLYTRGRYSPTRETGVHHFHRLLVKAMSEG